MDRCKTCTKATGRTGAVGERCAQVKQEQATLGETNQPEFMAGSTTACLTRVSGLSWLLTSDIVDPNRWVYAHLTNASAESNLCAARKCV